MEHRLPSSVYDDGIIDHLSLVARSSVVIDRALNSSRPLCVLATKRRRLRVTYPPRNPDNRSSIIIICNNTIHVCNMQYKYVIPHRLTMTKPNEYIHVHCKYRYECYNQATIYDFTLWSTIECYNLATYTMYDLPLQSTYDLARLKIMWFSTLNPDNYVSS